MSTTTGISPMDQLQRKERESFKHFFPNVSFITSILFGVSVSTSLSLPGQQPYIGLNDVQKSVSLFAWAACISGGGLVLSLLMQLLHTSPHFHELASSDENKRSVRWLVGFAGWLSVMLAAGGMALVAEGLKIVQRQAGLALQWLLFSFSLPVLFFWIVFRAVQSNNKRRSKLRDLENQSPTLPDRRPSILKSIHPSGIGSEESADDRPMKLQ